MKKVAKLPEVHLALSTSGEAEPHRFAGEEYMKEYLNAIIAHGGLFDHVKAAAFAGVSKQRIGELVKKGRIRVVTLDVVTPSGIIPGEPTIPGNDLVRWMQEPKHRGGRGKKAVPVQVEAMAA